MAQLQQNDREILDLEHRYWQALKDRDGDAAKALCDESCIIAGPHGFGEVSRDQLGEMVPRANYELLGFDIDEDAKVMRLGNDLAIIAYDVHERVKIDGEEVGLDAAETSTWIRKDGKWLCAAHTESLRGDPFGRDKHLDVGESA
jgi:hypothetical protein